MILFLLYSLLYSQNAFISGKFKIVAVIFGTYQISITEADNIRAGSVVRDSIIATGIDEEVSTLATGEYIITYTASKRISLSAALDSADCIIAEVVAGDVD